MTAASDTQDTRWSRGTILRIVVLLVVVAIAITLAVLFRDELSLDALAQRETALRDYTTEQPAVAYCIYFAIYVLVAALSLPGAAPLSIVGGWLLGFWPAVILTSFASTLGATLAMLLSRYVVGGYVQQRFGSQLARMNERLDHEGAFYLFSLRLIPVVPFFVINLVMGLTKMRATTFFWVSQLGMFPATCVFVLAGASSPSLGEIAKRGAGSLLSPTLLVALVLLGTLPLLLKWLVGLMTSKTAAKQAK